MARNRADIKLEMTTAFMANETLAAIYGFPVGSLFVNEFSKVSFENQMFDLFAYFMFLLEQLFDTHKKEVDAIIEEKMPHRASWYRFKAKAFQYGFALIQDSDKYNNAGFTVDQIEASKIVKYSAVTQSAGQLLIKVATESGGVLSPISSPQKASFDAYIAEIADCGVKYIVINNLPDILILTMQIYRDPSVIDPQGMSIVNGNYPVQDAILEFMKDLPFNGELVLAHLVDKLQNVEGVKIPHIINAESQIVDINTGLYLPLQPINVKTVPESGYFTIPNFDNVSYVV
ncbi:nucleotidyltransferase [Flavobacterium sp. I-SCBP12n]|uniref:Nucleotidyltransferase n=1 Tax=Flavobacterium pygoscelis TaxID=2893176 RepID=A0A9X2BR72_9FLAO|nr:nucleotidyltransferase [Flavobacterium pygoscelis]MCK8143216.1 nucleotidyltransferase [Flavobacterium pygoscelis]